MTTPTQTQTLSERAWLDLGEKLFGTDRTLWRFTCPHCGHVASGASTAELATAKGITFGNCPPRISEECIGRAIPGVGCNWAAYGLFSGPCFIIVPDGTKIAVFAFDQGST